MKNLADKFWKNVKKDESCWEWIGCKQQQGYGVMSLGKHGKSIGAHRYSYLLHNNFHDIGSVEVMHTCDNPSCVNPQHLVIGSHSENMRDMQNKGRANYKSGAEAHKSKLSIQDVKAIRAQYLGCRHKDIAKTFNVSRSTVSRVLSGKHYK